MPLKNLVLLTVAAPVALVVASASGASIVTSGLTLHFEADAGVLNGSGMAASNGENVATWVDQSASGFNATSSGTHEPIYSATAFNGHPTIVFTRAQSNTINQYLANTTDDAVPTNSARTVIVVGASADTRGGSLFTFRTTTAGGAPDAVFSRLNLLQPDASTLSYVYTDGVIQNTNVPPGKPITSPFVSTYKATSSDTDGSGQPSTTILGTISTQFNGVAEADFGQDPAGSGPDFRSESAAAASSPGFIVGDRFDNGGDANINQGWSGDIAEVLIYDRVLSDEELTQTDFYLSDKYGINAPEPTSVGAMSLAGFGLLKRRRKSRIL